MSEYIVTDAELTGMANAVRAKTGGNTPIEWKAGKGFADGVSDIKSYLAADEGKVVHDGALTAQGSLAIAENGTYDTTLISQVIANIGESSDILRGVDDPTADLGSNGDIYFQIKGRSSVSSTRGYLNTGINGGSDIEFEIDYRTSNSISSGDYGCIFGSREDSKINEFQLNTYQLTSQKGTFGNGNNRFAVSMQRNALQHFELHNNIITDINGSSIDVSVPAWESSYPLYLFALNSANSATQYGTLELFKLKIWKSGQLIKDYTPAKVNGVACLYNEVSDDYEYMTSGELTYSASTQIIATYCKVSGVWRELIGANIDDLNI